MSWDRYALGQKNIFYDEDLRLFPATVLPPHVERVRRSMMDFSCPIGGNRNFLGSSLVETNLKTLAYQSCPDPDFKSARKTLAKALSIVNGGYGEKKWENFFETCFFENLSESLSVCNEDSRRTSHCKYYYDAFKRETNERWDLFKDDGTTAIASFESLKSPQPDQAFFLPIYHTDVAGGIPTIVDPEARQWNQAQDSSIMEPFSWETLIGLNAFGLQPSPVRIFHKPPLEAHLKCYPWLIVEHKKENGKNGGLERDVCCQGANAAASAVSLVRHSAQYAVELPGQAHIPPIPVITTVGSRVTVWIMYFAKDFEAPCSRRDTNEVTSRRREEGYIMRTIWKGDMAKLVDILKFRIILENTHTWAMRAFKPLISTYIEQWIHIYPKEEGHGNAAQTLWNESKLRQQKAVEHRRAITPMVQALLDDHANMELDDMAHRKVTPLLLGLLVRQICSSEREFVFSEIDRVITEKLEIFQRNCGKAHAGCAHLDQRGDTAQMPPESESGQRASTFRSSPATQQPIVDDDDPNDHDYRPSQALSATSRPDDYLLAISRPDDYATSADEASEAEGSVALSSDYEYSDPVTAWRASDHMETPRARSSGSQLPERPSLHHRDSTPVSGKTITNSNETTPKPTVFKGRVSSGSVPQSPGSPQGSLHRERPVDKTPSASPVFAGRSRPNQRMWQPGRRFGGPLPTKSPQRRNSQKESDSDSEVVPEVGSGRHCIDLTRDSQEASGPF
ncbi:hypothetical protein FSARC_12139 [Fusarium sarcochroum]|uniref:Uncharacterized protein n=1 Tax=Fusarium sarcochroum TaxID=1208366 RepID=A0A8H4TAV0_9HYPO|nr:hypothetical protein FSARC_12139 [Fusarium sarcochroum]